MLESGGFPLVYSMKGGLNAWNGLVASGPPEAGMAVFGETDQVEDLVELAWVLEEGSRKFYAAVQEMLEDQEAVTLYQGFVLAEEKHKNTLLRFYEKSSGSKSEEALNSRSSKEDLMEGGIPVSKALSWAQGKNAFEILQFSMSLETNAYDLYIKMIPKLGDEESREVFQTLAQEEKLHLRAMGKLLEKRI